MKAHLVELILLASAMVDDKATPENPDPVGEGCELLREAREEVLRGLPFYLMTDQPPTCPRCGRRVRIIIGETTNRQVVKCSPCQFIYRLEED